MQCDMPHGDVCVHLAVVCAEWMHMCGMDVMVVLDCMRRLLMCGCMVTWADGPCVWRIGHCLVLRRAAVRVVWLASILCRVRCMGWDGCVVACVCALLVRACWVARTCTADPSHVSLQGTALATKAWQHWPPHSCIAHSCSRSICTVRWHAHMIVCAVH